MTPTAQRGITYTRPVVVAGLAFSVTLLGLSAIFVRLSGAPGVIAGFYRLFIASLLVAGPFLHKRRSAAQPLNRHGAWIAVLAGLLFALDLALWSAGIVMSGATNPTLMANTAAVWVGLASWLLWGERQPPAFWAGLLLATSGAMLVLGQDWSRALHFGLGTLLGLGAAFFYGAYYLVAPLGRARLDTLSFFWISTSSATVVLLVAALFLGQPLFGYSAFAWLNFLAMGLLVQIGAWLIINYVQGHLPASIVSTTLLGQPVMTAIFAALLLNESFSTLQIVGGGLTMAGIFIVHRSRSHA
jgi:drug/metabolite transporter (DMT)-like permease